MLTPKTLALIVTPVFVIAVVAILVGLSSLRNKQADICNDPSEGPYSQPSLTPFGTSTAVFVRFNGNGKGCVYVPAIDSWKKLSELVTE